MSVAAVRYVAIGDSFTEGVGDEVDGVPRGWADLVAAGLAQVYGEIDYASLAVRGKLLTPIVTGQLDAALALDPKPTMLTLNGGGNDMLRPGIHVDDLVRLTAGALDRAIAAGVKPVVLAGPDPSAGLPFGKTIHERGESLTEKIGPLADERELTFVNCFADLTIRRSEYWSEDRLHLNTFGHRRVADLVLAALGHSQPERPRPPDPSVEIRWRDDARYYRQYVGPWIGRRLRRKSSGDGHPPKHPTWHRIEAIPDAGG
jgi:lysophospholipase L1-like esterase